MAKQDKIIAWFLVFQAVAGAAVFAWLATHKSVSIAAWATFVPLIVAAFVAGAGSLQEFRWAALLGLVVFAVQTPIIVTTSFMFYVWLGVHFDLAAVWQGHAKLGVNMVGLGMLIWAAFRYNAPNTSSKRTGEKASPAA